MRNLFIILKSRIWSEINYNSRKFGDYKELSQVSNLTITCFTSIDTLGIYVGMSIIMYTQVHTIVTMSENIFTNKKTQTKQIYIYTGMNNSKCGKSNNV